MELVNITNENFHLIKKNEWYVLFWVTWGEPSFLQIDLFKKARLKAKCGLINVEENHDLAYNNKIELYPTTIYFVNGVEKYRFIGLFDGGIT